MSPSTRVAVLAAVLFPSPAYSAIMSYLPARDLLIVNIATPSSISASYLVPFTVMAIFPVAVSLTLTITVAFVAASTVCGVMISKTDLTLATSNLPDIVSFS